MLDMGPYYLTALVNLLGRVSSVTGITKTSFPQRVITSEPFLGEIIDVDVPTYLTGILEFESGVVGNLLTTFDVFYKEQAGFEVYGSEGTLQVPDPNFFGNSIYLLRPECDDYREIPLLFDYQEDSRGLGLADMAAALKNGRPIRAGSEQLFHVLDVMTAFERSSSKKAREEISSAYQRQKPMSKGDVLGIFND